MGRFAQDLETVDRIDILPYNKGGTEINSRLSSFVYNECLVGDCDPLDLIKYQNTFIGTSEFWERYQWKI